MDLTNLDIKDRTFLVTGATSGVGKAIATGLARQGAKVVILSRNSESGQATLNSIARATGNARAEMLVADLSLQSSIKKASEEFKRRYDNLHVLVNAAGAAYFEKQLTAEGVERMFAVNYLSHFLLTNQLLDMLKASGPARIITVAGNPRFIRNPKINFEDIQTSNEFSGWRALGQALTAKTIFFLELAKRLEGSGVTSVVFHPGAVKSNLGKTSPHIPLLLKVIGPLFAAISKDTCEIGVYLATAREVEKVNGVFFDDKAKIAPFKYATDMGNRLWEISEELTGTSAIYS